MYIYLQYYSMSKMCHVKKYSKLMKYVNLFHISIFSIDKKINVYDYN